MWNKTSHIFPIEGKPVIAIWIGDDCEFKIGIVKCKGNETYNEWSGLILERNYYPLFESAPLSVDYICDIGSTPDYWADIPQELADRVFKVI